ncbi:S phase cyclin A-associated protein in the endoplasmic reticulum [Halyomorpha halys]|uniref:S phase cyclin A-associated protein in the endoplasmic reticulum n=1 Tax=Halyomorpha halys TaxID=286706 RepID=UPI0006D5190E|nr:S phase cyclin A-associated protein in the endoplasmic reticulum [Halyomorpha halys]XP_014273614.1 S phase cyclin A-associated protein in the endoplasmic reticulum [Halyomorpha halys]XP_014273615.1 S phase cyclin A-associated protein in the endoplasmic reticulum [Halyomorpha halys]
MSETNLSDQPLEVVDMKGSIKNKERGDRYSFYVVESVIRACDELYQYCLLNMDSTLCHEMVIFLQSIAYDFVALNEWFKLKTVCKDLPPPVRTSVSPTRVSRHLRKMSRTRSFRRAKSEPGLNKSHFSFKEEKNRSAPKSAGVNVSAPDFVPAYSSEHDFQASWDYGLSESERNSISNSTIQSHIDPKAGIHNQFYSQSSAGYNEEERHLNASLVNLSYTQNVLPPNFWQYSTQINLNPFQHPTLQVPHHYIPHVPHIHLPYSLYTNSLGTGNMYPIGPLGNVVAEQMQCSINSGINHSFVYSTSETCLQPLDIAKNETEDRPPSAFSDDSDIVIICNKNDIPNSDKNEKNEDLNCEKDTSNRQEVKDVSLPLLTSDLKEKLYVVNEGLGVEDNRKTPEEISNEKLENITSSTEPLPPDKNVSETSMVVEPQIPEQIIVSQSNVILGLGEDECLIHFPELKPIYSHSKQKIRNKTAVKINNIKPSYEITCSGNGSKLMSDKSKYKSNCENSNEEKGTFSKLFKSSSTIEKQPVRPFLNTNKRKLKNTNYQLPSFPLKQNNTRTVKEFVEKTNGPISSCIDDENNDSGGWETVKGRSKWRDQTEFKQSRAGARNNGRLYQDNKHLQCINMTASNELGTTAGCDLESIIKQSGLDEELVVSKSIDDKTFKTKQRNTQVCNIIEKNLDSEKCAKKGRRNSSNYAQKVSDIVENKQTENLSCGDKTEKIDPNEMYSAYMQYINNVDEENQDSQTKNDKSILHPDAGEEIPQSVASLEEMTDFVNRDPIRALEFKRKLADEIKHQEDVKRRNEVKQQQAQKKRLQLLQCKTAKVREFVQKVEEVKAAQHQLALQRKSRIDLKLKKAEENRNMHLNIIKRKAHDEEEKLKEIAFINELEAQNRRHDSLALRQEHEERLQCLVEERQRRLEEKAAKEAAVEERRRVLEAERQEKLEKLKEKRRRKQEIIDRKQQEREQERLEIAREKAREREERLQARQSAQLATVEELQKRIQQKQEQSARRHGECIELIRQKAVEIGLHRNTLENVPNCINVYKPDEQLKCEISLKGPDHQKINKLNQKKRFKKIKSRMVVKGTMFIESLDSLEKDFSGKDLQLEKLLEKLKVFPPHDIYLWQDEECSSIDHYLTEMLTMLRTNPTLRNSFKQLKGYILMNSIIHTFNHCAHDRLSSCSLKCIIKIVNLCQVTCTDNLENCQYMVLSNTVVTLLESLKLSIKILSSSSKSWEILAEALLMLSSNSLEGINQMKDDQIRHVPDFSLRMKDLISYIMFSGVMNTVVNIFRASEIDEKFTHTSLIIPCISFFRTLLSTKFKTEEFMNMLKTTDLFGTVPFLYEGLMQHLTKDGSLPDYSLPIINIFLKLADLDLKAFQDILGSEGIALQWRGIASGLMMLCVRKKYFGELLHSVIKTVGYFAINNKKNQTLIQSGKHPTVLQQLVKLPFQYFCDSRHMELLFPTLIACSYQNATNRAIVESELNYSVLEKFIASEVGKKNKLMMFLLENQSSSIEVSQ